MVFILLLVILLPSQVIELINDDRAAMHIALLVENQELASPATNRAWSQLYTVSLSHDNWLESFTHMPCQQYGENLARTWSVDPNQIASVTNNALMNSPTHRANILDPRFHSIAVGVASEGSTVSLAELFC